MKLSVIPSGMSRSISPISLDRTPEEIKIEKRQERDYVISLRKVGELCLEANEMLASVRNHRLLELENWRGFKLELDKLCYVVEKLTRELNRMQDKRKNH